MNMDRNSNINGNNSFTPPIKYTYLIYKSDTNEGEIQVSNLIRYFNSFRVTGLCEANPPVMGGFHSQRL